MRNLIFTLMLLLPLSIFAQEKVGFSILYNGNIPNAAWGISLEKELNSVTVFVDYKIGGMLPASDRVKSWSTPEETNFDYYSYGVTSWGSYISVSNNITEKYGTAPKHSLINVGVGKQITTIGNTNVRINIGVGVCKTKNQLIKETSWFHYEHTNLELVNYNNVSSDLTVMYEVVSEKNEYKMNFTTNILFERNNTFVYGIGFDTKPMGVNLILGFKI